jgi:hypothetical protein
MPPNSCQFFRSLFLHMELYMTSLRHTLLSIAIASASLGAFAQTDAEHAQHHPAEPVKKATKAAAPKAPTQSTESMAAMDTQMKTMREMHEKMLAAKTPEERKALMADHMKAMQDGMSMMGKMGSMSGMGDMKGMGGMGTDAKKGGMSMDMMGHHDMMEKRMEMMTSMMQMMMDRIPTAAAQ